MAINASGAFNSPLSLWSSLYEDMNPTDLPEGLSPANEDMWFIPGSVQTRPALTRFLDSPPPFNPTIVSVEDFPLPNGDFAAVYLDSSGFLYQKLASNGAESNLSLFSAGVQFKAENAFNKQWYASFAPELSDAFSENHFVGVDIPRFYDGQTVWRVTQDAPGAPPLVADNLMQATIAAAGVPGLSISTEANSVSATLSGHTVTLTYGSPFFIKPIPGELVVVTGMTPSGYNGTWTIAAVTNSTIQYVISSTGLAPGTGGTATIGFVQVVTTAPNGFAVGNVVTIVGAGISGYNGNYTVRRILTSSSFTYSASASQLALGNSGGGTVQLSGANGNIAAGIHGCVVMFKSTNGAITGASLPFWWTAGGNQGAAVSSIPIGPAGTAQRILAFTPSGGANFYYIPPSVIPSTTGGLPVVTQGTIIDDNTTQSAVVNFSDQALTAGVQIDIDGNNLFNQIVLAPCLGVIEYQERLGWWGEINNIKNFVNMGFDGGYVGSLSSFPLGWSSDGSPGGSVAVVTQPAPGFAYSMVSSGGPADALISQAAYQDYYGAKLAVPGKTYILRLMLSISTTPNPPVTVAGNFVGEFFSTSLGSLGTASINLAPLRRGVAQWASATFSAPLPAALPSDLAFRIYLNGVTNTLVVYADEMMLMPQDQPVLAQQMRISYAGNPFGYDVISGRLGIDSTDSIVGAFKQRGYLYPLGNNSQFLTQNNGQTEPFEWNVTEYAQACGCSSPCAVASGEGITVWAGRYGRFIFAGDNPKKISQELQPTWDRINWDVETRIWLVNDAVERVIYTGLPLDEFTAPSIVQPTSYRSVDTAYNVPDPLHTSYSGKLVATDLCRKSTKWNLPMNCGAMVTQPLLNGEGTARQMIFGGGNGFAPGVQSGFANLYLLEFNKYTDDDYGIIGGADGNYYIPASFWNHEMEQAAPGLGLHRKLYTYLTAYALGVGNLQVTIYVDTLDNPVQTLRLYGLTLENLKHDLEWGMNVTAERIFLKVKPVPLQVATITNVSIVDDILTLRANVTLGATNYSPGQSVLLAGLTTATFLNGQTVTITKISKTGFQASFTHADYDSAPDTGTCTPPSITDAFLNINKLIVAGRMDKIFPVRGSYI